MMLKELRDEVYEANMDLPKHGLVVFTWGNASGVDRERGLFVIKPSGVSYDELTPQNLVVVDFDGNKVEGELNPSSDTATHAVLYKTWEDIGGVVHTHSSNAVSWAQAGRSIPCYGTTHADYFYGDVPCMRGLTAGEIREAYELNTGKVILEGFEGVDHIAHPGCPVLVGEGRGGRRVPCCRDRGGREDGAAHRAARPCLGSRHRRLPCPPVPA